MPDFKTQKHVSFITVAQYLLFAVKY